MLYDGGIVSSVQRAEHNCSLSGEKKKSHGLEPVTSFEWKYIWNSEENLSYIFMVER